MDRTPATALLAVLILAAGVEAAISDILPADRYIDWSNAGVIGGIPPNWQNCTTSACNTLWSGTVTASSINNAISSAPVNSVVRIPAGTYTLSGGIVIQKSNVTLRGAGADKTKLIFTTYDTCGGLHGNICISGPDWIAYPSSQIQPGGSNAHTIVGALPRGATKIPLDSVSGLSVGTKIVIDQANDLSDNGQFLICDLPSVPCSLEGRPNVRTVNGIKHSYQQFTTITAIDTVNKTVTINPGLYAHTFTGGKDAGIFWWRTRDWVGVEDMTLDVNNGGASDGGAIVFFNSYNCWASGLRVITSLGSTSIRNLVYLFSSAHITVQNSYFYGSKQGSTGYGFEVFNSGEDLIINNIFQHMYGSTFGPTVGTVVAFNYGIDNFIGNPPQTVMSPTFWVGHDSGAVFNLLEGNVANGLNEDVFHGSSPALTAFRNRFTGTESNGAGSGKTANSVAFAIGALHRYPNLIGNVLGTPCPNAATGCSNVYEGTSFGIYGLGQGNTEGGVTVPNDPLVKTTSMRWGNYDTVHGSTQWNTAEVPSDVTTALGGYPSQTLPASFVLSSKPSWWGNTPWPAIGPDVTGGDPSVGGHFYAIPSEQCYSKTANDTSYAVAYSNPVKLFNANNCYGAVSASDFHPADTGKDWMLSAAEVSVYNTCWKTPTCTSAPLTTYVSNANLMWKSRADGAYHYNSTSTCPLCWISGP